MTELFVRKYIEITASPVKVWEVLTEPRYTKQWISSFGIDGEIDSNWRVGSTVDWKSADGKIKVTGNVTKADPYKFLHFTVQDIEVEVEGPLSDKDGITYTLRQEEGKTILSVMQGDFGAKQEFEKYYEPTLKIWDTVLPIIKSLSEGKNVY